jgi:hypothetical protein
MLTITNRMWMMSIVCGNNGKIKLDIKNNISDYYIDKNKMIMIMIIMII